MYDNFLNAVKNESITPEDGDPCKDGVEFLIAPDENGAISLDHVQTRVRHKGDGSNFMLWLTDLADTFNTPLKVIPSSENDYTQKELIAWYMEAGFKPEEHYDDLNNYYGALIRHPKAAPFRIPEA